MKRHPLTKIRESVAYELARIGYPMEYATSFEAPYIEFEASTVYASTDKETVCANVHRLASRLWGLPSKPLSRKDLMELFRSVGK